MDGRYKKRLALTLKRKDFGDQRFVVKEEIPRTNDMIWSKVEKELK